MNKILDIAWKDLIVTFRDPAALVLMLVTPFALTLATAFAFGRLTGGGSAGGGLVITPTDLSARILPTAVTEVDDSSS